MSFRAVLDTNILISGVFWSGMPGKILEGFKEGKFALIVTKEITQEYTAKLQNIAKKLEAEDRIEEWIQIIFEKAIQVKPHCEIKLCRDKKDNIFLDAAAGGRAKYLVTRDDDLKRDLKLMSVMRRKHGVEIVSVSQFLKLI